MTHTVDTTVDRVQYSVLRTVDVEDVENEWFEPHTVQSTPSFFSRATSKEKSDPCESPLVKKRKERKEGREKERKRPTTKRKRKRKRKRRKEKQNKYFCYWLLVRSNKQEEKKKTDAVQLCPCYSPSSLRVPEAIQWLTILIDHKERDLVHLADNVLAAQDVINVVVHTLLAVALAAATNIAENDRRSRSPMSGAAGVGGSGGSAYGGQPHRTYEERAAAREQMMSSLRESSQQDRRVYVGNLSYDVKWHHLKDFMRSAGEVLFADVLLLPNGMSKVGAYT
ncbi:hypothetical protein EYC84_008906 [Monilinia fructicola]|uniref:RRM domain-containing protein n=1 Tax=Monilinia fructicola TaxID=38448 RepID=A0A5M9JC54_MONFR|nr:hypothetical protein EYC84_008906 [Monilinia fructicola]